MYALETMCNEQATAFNEYRGNWALFNWPLFNACETVRSWERSGRLSGVIVSHLHAMTHDEAAAFLSTIGRPQPHDTQNALREYVSRFFDNVPAE